MKLEIVHKIACEKNDSSIIPSKPRNAVQGFRLKQLYQLLIFLRIVLTLSIQTGWIHQEEFTNSLEIITGDYFDLQVFKSPTFNSSFPTRSIVFLHLTVYIPYILTHRFLSYVHPVVNNETVPNPSLLIIIPRIVQLLLSFLVDYILIRFCRIQIQSPQKKILPEDELEDEKEKLEKIKDNSSIRNNSMRLVTLASSQVILVFCTRTHSTLINLILFSIILCFVSDSIHRMDQYLPVLNQFHGINSKEKIREKVNLLKQVKGFGYNPIENLHWIAGGVVCGVFNDPEFFMAYASIPIFFYFQRGITNPYIGMTQFHIRLFTFALYFLIFSIPFIIWDSFYYNHLTLNDLNSLNLYTSSFVITPINYFVTKTSYFRDFSSFISIFLSFLFTFNILGILALLSIGKEISDIFFKNWKFKPRLDSHWIFLNCSWFLPLILLIHYKSIFDLVPLIFPLVTMHGHKIPLISRFSWKLGFLWFITNLIGVIFWGYLSQGGILTSFLELNDQLTPLRFNETYVDLLLAQMTAIPPTFVLSIPSKWKTILLDSKFVIPELEITPYYEKYVQALPKTVLKLELDSKIRVFHIGISPLPLCHFENEMIRILHSKYKGQMKVNFLLLPNNFQSLDCFRKSNLIFVKTYSNHFHIHWPFLEENNSQTKSGISWKFKIEYFLPKFTYGLNLYRFEESIHGKQRGFLGATNEKIFNQLFSFSTYQNSFLTYITHLVLFVFTVFLFLVSFLTFLI